MAKYMYKVFVVFTLVTSCIKYHHVTRIRLHVYLVIGQLLHSGQ